MMLRLGGIMGLKLKTNDDKEYKEKMITLINNRLIYGVQEGCSDRCSIHVLVIDLESHTEPSKFFFFISKKKWNTV